MNNGGRDATGTVVTRRRMLKAVGVVAIAAVALVAFRVLRSESEVRRELNDIVAAVGVDDDVNRLYTDPITTDFSEGDPTCDGVAEGERSSHLGRVIVGDTSFPPDEIVDRLAAHYRAIDSSVIQMYAPTYDTAYPFIFTITDEERELIVQVYVQDDSKFTAEVVTTGCGVGNYDTKPPGSWEEVPLPN